MILGYIYKDHCSYSVDRDLITSLGMPKLLPKPPPFPRPLIDPKLRGDIALNDSPPLRRFPLLLPSLRLLMLSKMLDILGMGQILLLDIISTMILLPMMDLILILIITMMSRPKSKVR
jgi:hypothetical protein